MKSLFVIVGEICVFFVVADLVTSLEEVNMWKGNCQHQMNAKSSNDGVSEELAQAMRGEEEAQAEASRWKEKAVASEELEGTNAPTAMFFWRTDGRTDGWTAVSCWYHGCVGWVLSVSTSRQRQQVSVYLDSGFCMILFRVCMHSGKRDTQRGTRDLEW